MPRGNDECPAPLPTPGDISYLLDDDMDQEEGVPEVAPEVAGLNGERVSDILDGELDNREFVHEKTWACDYSDDLLHWTSVRGKKPNIDGLPCPPVCEECGNVPEYAIYRIRERGNNKAMNVCGSCAPSLTNIRIDPVKYSKPLYKTDLARIKKAAKKYEFQVNTGRAMPRPFDPDDEVVSDMDTVIDVLRKEAEKGDSGRENNLEARRSVKRYIEEVERNPLVAWPKKTQDYIMKMIDSVHEADADESIVEYEIGEKLEDIHVEIKRFKIQRNQWGTQISFTGRAANGHRYWLPMNTGTPNAETIESLEVDREFDRLNGAISRDFILREPHHIIITNAEVKNQGSEKDITFLKRPRGKAGHDIIRKA